MTRTVTDTVVLPTASPADTRRTAAAVLPYRDPPSGREVTITAVGRTEDGMDKTPFEGVTECAGAALEIAADRFEENGVPIGTVLESDANPIVPTPRNVSCGATPSSGNTTPSIVTNTDRQPLFVPDPEETD